MRTDYRTAGVNIDAGNRAVDFYREIAGKTRRAEVVADVGGFAGLFRVGAYQHPLLVAGADGVGSKLKIAFALDRHDTVGIDCVAMNVNDVLTLGAEPLFFLDYLAVHHLEPEKAASVVSGVAEGCRQAGCALLGGETAEMPDLYSEGEYDLAGFAVGVVEEGHLIDGHTIQPGDVLIGLASTGLHSNGFSLARRVLLQEARLKLDEYIPSLGTTLGEELLRPTRIYVRPVLHLLQQVPVRGLVHITGGGFVDNIPRVLPSGLGVHIRRGTWPVPPIFDLIAARGQVAPEEMYRVFNMGIGMVAIVPPDAAGAAIAALAAQDVQSYEIGEVVTRPGVEIA